MNSRIQPGICSSCETGVVYGHAHGELHAPLDHAAVVAHAALQQVAVGKDDLLAIEAAQSRALDADVLHRAQEGVDGEEVADHERPVERDRQRGEQIAQHVLRGQRHGHAAHAQARDQRRDVDAEVVEREQQHQRPDHHTRDEADDVERAQRGAVIRAAVRAATVDPRAHRAGQPQANLPEKSDEHGRGDDALQRVAQFQRLAADTHRHDQHEEQRGAAQRPHGDLEDLGALGGLESPRVAANGHTKAEQDQEHDPRHGAGNQPGRQRVVEDRRVAPLVVDHGAHGSPRARSRLPRSVLCSRG
jgi:hypothetical protein